VEDVCDRVVIYYGGKIQAAGPLKDLLAKPDSLRITTPVLPRATLERVLATIRQDAIAGEVRVDNPTQNLESYFLDVVQKARAAQETSGAQSGARVAAYLRGNETVPAAETVNKVLDRLAAPVPAKAPVPAPVSGPPVENQKLAALARPMEAAPAAPPPAAPEKPPADLAKADEKLSSLLGKPKP